MGDARFYSKQFINAEGMPYSGCKVYHYAAGTSTLKAVWSDAEKTTALPNPVIGDSRGLVSFYGDGNYRLVVTDSAGNSLYDWPTVPIVAGDYFGTSVPAVGSGNTWQEFGLIDGSDNFLGKVLNTGTGFAALTPGLWTNDTDITAITNRTMILSSTVTLQGNTTVPASVSIMPLASGMIVANGKTLTINGPVVGNPMHQWLSGFAAGDVKFRDQFTGSITPVWWGYVIDNNNASVQTTNATALACWIQSVANSAGGYPMAELVLPAGEGFYSGSGLTVSYGQMLHIRGAAGGRYSAGGSAVSGRASMLSYTGTGTALTLDGTTGNFSGLRMDGIYLKGTSSAAKGLYINTCGGVSLDHCHVYGFSATNVRGVDIIHSQDISFDKCGFSGNYIGTFQDGAEATAENTTITYNKCAWVANTVGLIDYMTDTTILIAPLFSENKAEAVIVDYTQTTHGGSHFKIYGGYQSGNNATSAGYIIDIKGNGASGSTWSRGIEIDGLFMGSAGAAATGQIRLRNTRQAKLESLLFSSTLLQIVASRTDNLNLVLINVDDGQADSMIQDGSGNTVYWPHVGRSQAQTLASATALNIPSACRVAHVTGTTNITSLTGGWPGQVVTLIFDGILTLTDGNNIKIGGNFVTTADDSITLVYDGTNWYEGGARSVN